MIKRDYCPVCGVACPSINMHRCDSKRLGAIEAANTRAANAEDLTTEHREPFWRTEAYRLDKGLGMRGEDYGSDAR